MSADPTHPMQTLRSARKLIHWASALGLLLYAAACATPEGSNLRYRELAKVINRNVGYAHMTRGFNVCTILALRDEVTDQDIEVLAQLLESNDSIHRQTAAHVLSVLGPAAVTALQTRGARLGPTGVREVIADTKNTEQALASYRKSDDCGFAKKRSQAR
jgi:hypothetical protein